MVAVLNKAVVYITETCIVHSDITILIVRIVIRVLEFTARLCEINHIFICIMLNV